MDDAIGDPFNEIERLARMIELLSLEDRELVANLLESMLAADPYTRRDEWGFFERCAHFEPDSDFGKYLFREHLPMYRVIIPALDSLQALIADALGSDELEPVTSRWAEANVPALGGPAGVN